MKKVLVLIAILLMTFMILPLAAYAQIEGDKELPFSDVKSYEWYYDNVKKVYDSKLMTGVSETEFNPYGTLTRAMCVTILYRAAGEPDVTTGGTFYDVEEGEYYFDAVAWAKENGVVNGKTETVFDPNGKITRAEFSAMLFRYLDTADLSLPEIRDGEPADAESVPEYASRAVGTMYRAEVVNGRENGAFDPDADITRAEAAAMIDRFLEKAKSIITIVDDEEYKCVRVSFAVPDAEEGFFNGGTIYDVSVGYIPEGLALFENEFKSTDDIRSFLISTKDTVDDGFQPFIVLDIAASSEVEWGWSACTYEGVYLTELNGMDAYVIEKSGSVGETEVCITAITFGDRDVTVNIVGVNLSHEEVWKVAESIEVAPVD